MNHIQNVSEGEKSQIEKIELFTFGANKSQIKQDPMSKKGNYTT